MGHRALKAGGFRAANGVTYADISGFPKSGPSGSLVDSSGQSVPQGSVVIDYATGVMFVNEGTSASPYWTPISYNQRNLLAWFTDFRNGTGKALADTAATATLSDGLRIHGDSIADTDAGLTVAMDENGPVGSLVTGNENADCSALSFGTGTNPLFQPDQSGTLVMDINIAQSAAITNRSMAFGWCGSAADALPSPVTGSGTTISFAATHGDDFAGLFFSTGLTATARIYAPHDKGNANASIATTATGVDTGVDQATAGVYQRFRVEVDPDGAVRMFIDKVQVASFAAGTLDTDEEIQPVLVLSTLTTANATALVKRYAAWGKRP